VFIVLGTIQSNEVNMQEQVSGFVQQSGDSASLVTAYAAQRLRDGFSHPHQEHMKDTYKTDLSLLRIVMENTVLINTL